MQIYSSAITLLYRCLFYSTICQFKIVSLRLAQCRRAHKCVTRSLFVTHIACVCVCAVENVRQHLKLTLPHLIDIPIYRQISGIIHPIRMRIWPKFDKHVCTQSVHFVHKLPIPKAADLNQKILIGIETIIRNAKLG